MASAKADLGILAKILIKVGTSGFGCGEAECRGGISTEKAGYR